MPLSSNPIRAPLLLLAHKYFQCWLAFLHFFFFLPFQLYSLYNSCSEIAPYIRPPTDTLRFNGPFYHTYTVRWLNLHVPPIFILSCLSFTASLPRGTKTPGAKSASCSPLDLSLFPAQCTADYIHPIKNTLNKAWNVNNPNNNILLRVYRFREIESPPRFWQ